jgi:hypothetical protein
LDAALAQYPHAAQQQEARKRDDVHMWAALSVEALALVVKGFAGGRGPDDEVVRLLTRALQSALQAAQALRPSQGPHQRLPSSVRRLCHALIPTIGAQMVAYLPVICMALLDPPDADVAKTVDLLNQMMAAFRAALAPQLSQTLVPILRSINAHMAGSAKPVCLTPSPRACRAWCQAPISNLVRAGRLAGMRAC